MNDGVRFKFCEKMINKDGIEWYCGAPALYVGNRLRGKYLYLCKQHFCEAIGLSEKLRDNGRKNYKRVRRICPYDYKVIYVKRYEAERNKLNFCSNKCRAHYYYHPDRFKKKGTSDS